MPSIRYTIDRDYDSKNWLASDTSPLPTITSVTADSYFGYIAGGERGFFMRSDRSTAIPITYGVRIDLADIRQAVLVQGGQRGDTLIAGAFKDTIYGRGGDDVLIGGGGDDVLHGGAGADRLEGGSGYDLASYADAGAGVSASLGSKGSTGEAAGDSYVSIEGLQGSAFADRLVSNGPGQSVMGLAGNDKLFVRGTPALVDGGSGTDALYVAAQPNLVFASDTIKNVEAISVAGGASVDVGAFTAAVAPITSTSKAGSVATIIGTQGADRITLGQGMDVVAGGLGNDRIYSFNSSAEIKVIGAIDGGDGSDTLSLQGNHRAGGTIRGIDAVTVSAGKGATSVEADFNGAAQGLTITATTAKNVSATIFGGNGDDRITGGDGNDFITGGAGADRLNGGLGADTFLYASISEMTGDKIVRLDQGDRIVIPYAPTESSQYYDIGESEFTGWGEEYRIERKPGGVTIFEFDLDGDKIADATLFVQSDAPISSSIIDYGFF